MSYIKKARLKFLDETVNHFNLNNRGIKGDSCSYEAGCAIGRHLNKDLGAVMDKQFETCITSIPTDIYTQLPEWLKHLGIHFLQQVQELHDAGFNWSETGLSEHGKEKYNFIVKNWIV